jgi:Fe-S oxidoreductase
VIEQNVDKNAEYVFIAGCGYPELIPHVFKAIKDFFDFYEVDYTLLSKEYCCGYPVSRPAVISKDEATIIEAKSYSSEFIMRNFKQAERIGAKSIVLFCAGCEPNYANLINETKLEVISYTDLIDRYFTSSQFNANVDYYAGCYRFRRKLTSVPLNIEAAQRVLNKIKGLKVNQLDNNLCCFKEQQVEQLLGNIKTKTLITVCSGCYYTLKSKMKEDNGCTVKMLPEIVMEAIHSK